MMRKRIFAAFVCLCMMMALVPSMAYANDTVYTGGLCEHHTKHDDACGYTEGTAEIPCSHKHNESCGGLTDPAACNHSHDEACCYVPATEGTPCTFVCEVCNAQDSGNPATPSDAQPEECTCETLCTDEEINEDCPVCSAEGADLSACKGAVSMPLGVQRNVENIPYLDENGTQQTAASATQVTNSDTQWTGGWYVAQGDITINQLVTVSDTVYLILEDGCNLTVNGGILLQSGSNMYIYAQSTEKERMGSLTATGTDAGFKEAGSGTQTLTIAGGKISASGSDVGISAVNLTITDGYVSALGTDLYGTSIAVYNATISGGFVDLYGDFAGTLSTGIDGHAVISSTGEIKNIAADCKGFFLIQKAGKIYGDTFTLTQDLNIANSNIVVIVEEGQTLTLDDGVTLTIPKIATLTNNGTLNNNGTIINTGTLNNSGTLNNTSVLNNAGSIINNGTLTGEVNGSGTVITTPTITTPPTSQTVTEDETATFTVEAAGGNLSYQWQQSTDKGSSWTNIDSATSDTYTTGKTTMDMSGTQYRCVVKNSIDEVTSDAATLTVQKATTPIEPKYVRYIVEHYKQNADGSYTLADTEQPIDEIGKTVTATPKTYEGYTYNPNAAGTVVSGTLKAISSPDDIVTLKLYYDITLYTVTVNGSYAQTTGAGSYAKDATVTIDAGTRSGYTFDGWTSADGVTFADKNRTQTTFTMPDKAVTVTANWKKKSSGGSVFFWDLKFDTNGGSKIDTVTEWEYSTIDLDEYVPEKEGYKFVGWYADEDLTKKIDEVYLTQDTTVYAKWEKIEEEVSEEPEEVEETEETETISFLDVKESDWFYDAVFYAVENGLMSGMSEDIFAPNTSLTREMLAVVLYNVEGQPESTEANTFTDVKGDMWYTDAILWANANGIVAGYDNGAYGVGDFITREQFTTILYRYAQFKGYDTTQGGMAVREFSDYENISDYARTAMAWAVNAGIMGGMDDGTLMPQGKATRAEAATMLMNFCENVVK